MIDMLYVHGVDVVDLIYVHGVGVCDVSEAVVAPRSYRVPYPSFEQLYRTIFHPSLAPGLGFAAGIPDPEPWSC
jgi:hypothetical protein